MTHSQPEGQEAQRLAELRGYEILDTPPQQQFDDLAVLAAHICGTPVGLVSLVDADRLFFKAHVGTDLTQLPRDNLFCEILTAGGDELLCVEDASLDPRFAGNAVVCGPTHVRFYAGVPLTTAGGRRMGALCVLDTVPRQLTVRQTDDLKALGRQAVSQLELRRGARDNARLAAVAKQAERRARHDAEHDPLTGLPNRTLINQQVADCVASSHIAPAMPYVVMFLDVDHFKVVNDSLGHAAGDLLLSTVASRLNAALGDYAPEIGPYSIGRFGGDEFVILLSRLPSTVGLDGVVRACMSAIRRPFLFGGTVVHPEASVGIAVGPGNYYLADELLRDADAALYQAKAAGRGRYVIFDDRMHEQAVRRLKIEGHLRSAVEQGELALHYQPVVSLGTRGPVGVEALVRWRHDGKLVSPADFIPIAEDTGVIVPIGRWVLTEAVRQAAEWQAKHPGLAAFKMAVNVSRKQLADDALVPLVRRLLAEHRLDPAVLHLEITESVIMGDADAARRTLSALRDLGVQLAMDDFGTGYSSLSCLHDYDLDLLKVDRSFVANLGNRREATVLKAVLELAHGLGMKVVAEGIETPQQAAFLTHARCDYGQGYLFARPLDAAAAEAFLIGDNGLAMTA